jgi:hypothetical protein
MRPDYPHKIFPDFRNHFFLLMETLAMLPPHPLTLALKLVPPLKLRQHADSVGAKGSNSYISHKAIV